MAVVCVCAHETRLNDARTTHGTDEGIKDPLWELSRSQRGLTDGAETGALFCREGVENRLDSTTGRWRAVISCLDSSQVRSGLEHEGKKETKAYLARPRKKPSIAAVRTVTRLVSSVSNISRN